MKWCRLLEDMKVHARAAVSLVRALSEVSPLQPSYDEVDVIAGHLAHAVRGTPTAWLEEVATRAISSFWLKFAKGNPLALQPHCYHERPVIDISEAVREYRWKGYQPGEPTWISIDQEGYPSGVDVQIEEDDDVTTPDFGFLKAWVYPKVKRGEFLETDTQVLLAAIPECMWTEPDPWRLNRSVEGSKEAGSTWISGKLYSVEATGSAYRALEGGCE